MLGLDQSPKSLVMAHQPVKQVGLRAAITFAATSAVFFALAGAAQAQDCVNGYRMVKEEIPVLCSSGTFAGSSPNPHSVAAQALYAGRARTVEHAQDSSDPSQCIGGYRTITTTANGWTLPMPCHDCDNHD